VADRYSTLLKALRSAVTDGPGILSPDERKRLLAGAADSSLGDLALLVQLDAAALTDEQVHSLLRSGNSEGALFEAIVCGALAAGLCRLKAGLDALDSSS
jgi:hypothetical protein